MGMEPSTTAACSEPHPTWPWTLPNIGHLQLLQAEQPQPSLSSQERCSNLLINLVTLLWTHSTATEIKTKPSRRIYRLLSTVQGVHWTPEKETENAREQYGAGRITHVVKFLTMLAASEKDFSSSRASCVTKPHSLLIDPAFQPPIMLADMSETSGYFSVLESPTLL